MKLTLHVGLPKTATSSIQQALTVAKPALLAQGVFYPGTTASHHHLARAVQAAEAGKARMAKAADEVLDMLADEVRQAGVGHVVLSSEHMISAAAPAVARLRAMLEARFAVTSWTVLCYLREPVAFATSMCQQDVKSGKIGLAGFYAAPWPFALADWLSRQSDCFGRESLDLRLFDAAHLANGDIVEDLFQALGLPGFRPGAPVPRLNPSLTREGVAVADALFSIRPSERRQRFRRRQYKRLLEAIPGVRFVLPEAVQTRLIEASRADLAALRARFGVELVPQRVPVAEEGGMDPTEALQLAAALAAKVEG